MNEGHGHHQLRDFKWLKMKVNIKTFSRQSWSSHQSLSPPLKSPPQEQLLVQVLSVPCRQVWEQKSDSCKDKLEPEISSTSSPLTAWKEAVATWRISHCLILILWSPEHHFRKIFLECCCLCSHDDRRVTIQIDLELRIQLVPRIPHSGRRSYDHCTSVRQPSLTELQDHHYSLCLLLTDPVISQVSENPIVTPLPSEPCRWGITTKDGWKLCSLVSPCSSDISTSVWKSPHDPASNTPLHLTLLPLPAPLNTNVGEPPFNSETAKCDL